MTKRQKFFSALGRFFKDFFTKNIVLKIVVLLFAILLWGFVIAEENPEYTKRVYGVEIEIRGEDMLQSKGWMMINRGTTSTDVDVKCQIGKHGALDASRIDCYVDLTRITNARSTDGDTLTVPLDVKCEVASDYGTIEGCTVERVEIKLAKTQTLNNQTVEVDTTGTLPDDLIVDLPKSVTIASLTGQQSQVRKISKLKATVDLDDFAKMEPGVYNVNLPIKFYEKGATEPFDFVTSNGEPITTGVRVTIRACKEFPIFVNIATSEEFEERFDYQIKIVSAETIKLCADRRDILEAIKQVETEQIYLRQMKTEETRNVSLIIPDETTLENGLSKASASVIITVTEKQTSVDIEVPILYSNTRENIYLDGNERKTVTIRVTGTYSAIEALNPTWFSASVALENYMQGTFRLPIRILFDGDASAYKFELIDPEDGFTDVVLEEILPPEPEPEPEEPEEPEVTDNPEDQNVTENPEEPDVTEVPGE